MQVLTHRLFGQPFAEAVELFERLIADAQLAALRAVADSDPQAEEALDLALERTNVGALPAARCLGSRPSLGGPMWLGLSLGEPFRFAHARAMRDEVLRNGRRVRDAEQGSAMAGRKLALAEIGF